MKVISGFLKGRNIKGFDINGTRPTMDRVKESLFAIIQNYIDDSIVLDLFAGSGNLGIESISNGSKRVYFNDINKESIKVIKTNLKNFDIMDKSIVLNYDYNKALDYLNDMNMKFDIIFLDPPYKEKILNEIIEKILKCNLLNKNGIIVCEISNDYINSFDMLEKIKQKKYGDKEIVIFKHIKNMIEECK